MKASTVEPRNNGHSGVSPLVHCREVVPISEVMPCMLQSVGGNQFVRGCPLLRASIIGGSTVFLFFFANHSRRHIFPDHAVSK